MEQDNFSMLCSIWDEIGPFNMNFFSDRLILQKKIFLLQQLGENLKYDFRKYIRGPYCSQLATDGYRINAMESINGGNVINNNSIEKIKKLGENHESDALWFELISFIVYLKNINNKNKEEIRTTVIEEKPYLYDESSFEEAYSRLIEIGIIN